MRDIVERLRATTDGATVNPDGLEAASEIERLRAALILAHKYVLVQSCGLSLMPDDSKRDLAIIEAALAREKQA